MVTSFKRVGDVWIPRRMEMVYRPRGQSLPAAETSRLEIYDGNYDAALPPSWFDPAAF